MVLLSCELFKKAKSSTLWNASATIFCQVTLAKSKSENISTSDQVTFLSRSTSADLISDAASALQTFFSNSESKVQATHLGRVTAKGVRLARTASRISEGTPSLLKLFTSIGRGTLQSCPSPLRKERNRTINWTTNHQLNYQPEEGVQPHHQLLQLVDHHPVVPVAVKNREQAVDDRRVPLHVHHQAELQVVLCWYEAILVDVDQLEELPGQSLEKCWPEKTFEADLDNCQAAVSIGVEAIKE